MVCILIINIIKVRVLHVKCLQIRLLHLKDSCFQQIIIYYLTNGYQNYSHVRYMYILNNSSQNKVI